MHVLSFQTIFVIVLVLEKSKTRTRHLVSLWFIRQDLQDEQDFRLGEAAHPVYPVNPV
jgi:hypothetical protein